MSETSAEGASTTATSGSPAGETSASGSPGGETSASGTPAGETSASGTPAAEGEESRETALAARGLHVRFGPARAVDGVELEVGSGEIVALVGESGCGKTTLARALLGLVRPAGGRVEQGSRPLSYAKAALKEFRRHVQLVLQDPTGSLNPRHTVYEAVAEGLRIHGIHGRGDTAADLEHGEERLVAGALAKAGLRPPERFFLRYPHELSGGQRQRVVIAGALVLEPDVLVADEPVSSLDASVRGEILALLLRLRAELGLSVLVVTHDLGLAWNIADRVAVMYLGRIVETGPAAEVLLSPRHPYTKALLSVVPEINKMEPIVLAGEAPDPSRIPAGCRFRPRCPAYAAGPPHEVAVLCETESPAVLPADQGHHVACHLPEAG